MLNQTTFRSSILVLFALCGLLTGCGGGDSQSKPTPVALPSLPPPVITPAKWVVMGSSTATGAGASAGKGWTSRLQADLVIRNITIENISRGGTTTYHGLSGMVAPKADRPAPDPTGNIDKALSLSPTVLLLAYPTNDTALGYSVEETVGNILSMRSSALASGIRVLVLSTQPRNLSATQLGQLRQVDARLKDVVGTCFVEVHAPLASASGNLSQVYDTGDGIHVNDAGHEIIAKAVLTTANNGTCIQL